MQHDKDELLQRQDDMWNISELMPKRKHYMGTVTRHAGATDAVELEIPVPLSSPEDAVQDSPLEKMADMHRKSETQTRHTADPTLEKNHLVDDYCPHHTLIRRVQVYDIPSEYNYYEQFLDHARRIRDLRGHQCCPVPFFSYVPEYSQLTKAQLDWYLWWREQAWQGKYLDTDYSYILLYASEIINTGGHSSPEWGQRQLCGLWRAYHNEYRRLNWLMAEWICDFSLIWHLAAPFELLNDGELPRELIEASSMKEFYMSWEGGAEAFCKFLITYCSGGCYKASKFSVGDAKSLYEQHVPAAINEALQSMYSIDGQLPLNSVLGSCSRVRVAYTGVLCTYQCRKKLLVDYYCLSQAHTLRMMISNATKYAENKLRAYLGVKSRLGVKELDERIIAAIDAYFARELPQRRRQQAQPAQTDYERLYDVPNKAMSLAEAERIEQASWQTTERLVEAFEDDASTDYVQSVPAEPMQPESSGVQAAESIFSSVADSQGDICTAFGEYMEFLHLVDTDDAAGQRKFAQSRGQMIDSVFDKINEISMDFLGDVILIENDGRFSIVEEYRGELFL